MKPSFIFVILLGIATLTNITGCEADSNNSSQSDRSEEIKISGSGSSYRSLKLLAAAYEEKNPNTKIIFNTSNQTSGGIRGVKDDVIDIGATSRDLTPEEKDGVEYRVVAKDALVVATHKNVKGVKNLSTEQLRAIYKGDVDNWQKVGGSDEEIIVLDRSEDEAAKIVFRKYYLGKDLKVTPKAALMQKQKHVVEALLNTPNTIGSISLAKAVTKNLEVNTLSLDGIEANLTNVNNGKYKMTRDLGIVWKGKPAKNTSKFIDFLFSEEAIQKLQQAGYVADKNR